MLCRASDVVLIRVMSSEANSSLKWCCSVIAGVSDRSVGLSGEVDAGWRDGFWNETGQLGLNLHQFGESKCLVTGL